MVVKYTCGGVVSPGDCKAFIDSGKARDLIDCLSLNKPSWTKGPVFNIFKEGDALSFHCCCPTQSIPLQSFLLANYSFCLQFMLVSTFLYCLIEESTKLIKIKLNLF